MYLSSNIATATDKYATQIMDGSPSRGETIPIRLFLGGFDLTPTFREVNKKYSTRYYLSLVLIDEGMLSICSAWSYV